MSQMSPTKKSLIAYKEKLLQEMKYIDSSIEEIRSRGRKPNFEAESSGSEEELLPNLDHSIPSIFELESQQKIAKTCYLATRELTSLEVIQQEINVLVDDPEYDDEPPVSEPGLWRSVFMKGEVEIVPFIITFLVHQPVHKFGAPSYRGLRVCPENVFHQVELERNVLSHVRKPSDAIQVLTNYGRALRSRRTSLADLKRKFADTLKIKHEQECGYKLKCDELLELSWTLRNKRSPYAPFRHRINAILYFNDDSCVKIVRKLHVQLSDPAIGSAERTRLIAKIITTCQKAQRPTQEPHVSTSSDPEVSQQNLPSPRTNLGKEPEAPKDGRGRAASEAMPPPKSLPKKGKPEGKENVIDNRRKKRKRENSREDMNKNKKLKPNTGTKQTKGKEGEEEIKNDRGKTNPKGQSSLKFKTTVGAKSLQKPSKIPKFVKKPEAKK